MDAEKKMDAKKKFEQCKFPMHDRNYYGFCNRFDCRPCRVTELIELEPSKKRLIIIIDSLMKELYEQEV